MNKGNECSHVWLKVKLTREQHRRLKVLAAERGNTLAGLVVSILGEGDRLVVKGSVPLEKVSSTKDKPFLGAYK